ncbi:MAG: hypothetical protein HY741_28700 [Chloroflexi bacterium]|nr:hypothetical protein [Chloroflexota bacterium]
MTLGHKWLLALVALTGVLVLQLPYVLGYVMTPPETMYTGLLINVEDANYITIMQRGSEGAWMHSLRFTSEPDAPAFLYVFYLALGHVGHVLGVGATTMWHLARVVFTFIAFLLAFGFVGTFIADSTQCFVAYLLAIAGSGFDWFAFPWEHLDPTSATPVDLKMADAHLFSAALTFPHYLASISLLLILFWCTARLCTENLSRVKIIGLLLLGGLANIGIALVYPFFVILSCGVLSVYFVFLSVHGRKFLWREGIFLGALILPVSPLVYYYEQAFAESELLRVWSAQSQTFSPNPLHYLLTYAPYLIFALWGAWRVGLGDASQARRRVLLWTWVLVVALLVYVPLGPQRRFLQGVQIPLAILATFGLFEVALPRLQQAQWFQELAHRRKYTVASLSRLVVTLCVALICLSSIYQWVSAIALTAIVQPYPLFRPRDEVAAMDWLRTQSTANDIVLSSYWSGSYLPLRSGMRVYLGHYYETIHFQEKMRAVDELFDAGTAESTRLQFLRANRIDYLFYGRAERALGDFDPAKFWALQPVYANKAVVIYRTKL